MMQIIVERESVDDSYSVTGVFWFLLNRSISKSLEVYGLVHRLLAIKFVRAGIGIAHLITQIRVTLFLCFHSAQVSQAPSVWHILLILEQFSNKLNSTIFSIVCVM